MPTRVVRHDIRGDQHMPTWDALARHWITGRVKRREIVHATARNHTCALASLTTLLGQRATISHRDIDRWLESRAHLKASTVRSDYAAIRGWCQWLVHEGHLRRDPTFGRRAPREPRRIPRYVELDDVAAVLDVALPDTRASLVCWLMFGCGLRCVEVAGLEVGDWDRRHQTLTVAGKGGHEREVPVPDPVRAALDRYLVEHPATVGPLVRSRRDPSVALQADTISGLVSDLMADAGIKRAPRDGVSAHAFRHSCASDMLEASGGNLWLVAELLGHQNLGTLRVYLRHARSAEMRAAVEQREYPQAA